MKRKSAFFFHVELIGGLFFPSFVHIQCGVTTCGRTNGCLLVLVFSSIISTFPLPFFPPPTPQISF